MVVLQSFGELVHKPLLVDLTVEEGQRLKVIYGSCAGFHAVDVDSGSVYDIYLPTHVRAAAGFCFLFWFSPPSLPPPPLSSDDQHIRLPPCITAIMVNWMDGSEQMWPPVLRGLWLTFCPLLMVRMSPWLGAAHSGLTWAHTSVSGVAAKSPSALQRLQGRWQYKWHDSPLMRFNRVGKGQVALGPKVSCYSLYTEVSDGPAVCAVMHLPKRYSLQCRSLRSASVLLAPGSLSAHGKKWALLQTS